MSAFPELAKRWAGNLYIAPREGKYYGTEVLNREGHDIIKFWTAEGEPSSREKERFGNWTPEAWAEYVSDSHWECEADYQAALEFVRLAESLAE